MSGRIPRALAAFAWLTTCGCQGLPDQLPVPAANNSGCNPVLRNVVEEDLRIFFEHQRDPEATAMAAFTAREWEAFISHWRHEILGNPANEARTILIDDQVAGYVGSWEQEGRRLVAYWIGREYWGRGVARAALDEFLRTHEHHRPIHAYVALSNPRSMRVLEKCGFQRVGEPVVVPGGVAEVLFQFDGAPWRTLKLPDSGGRT